VEQMFRCRILSWQDLETGPCIVAWNIHYVVMGGCFLCFLFPCVVLFLWGLLVLNGVECACGGCGNA
jgi:hypothetical protein